MTYYYAIVVILVYNYSSMHFCIGIFLVKDILLSVIEIYDLVREEPDFVIRLGLEPRTHSLEGCCSNPTELPNLSISHKSCIKLAYIFPWRGKPHINMHLLGYACNKDDAKLIKKKWI